MLRMLFFAGLGVVLAGFGLSYLGVEEGLGWGLGLGMSISIFSGTLIIIGKAMKAGALVPTEALQQARAEGRIGHAIVQSLSQTGTKINDEPVCNVVVAVQPPQGMPFLGQVKMIVPLTLLPRYQPGELHEVAFFGPDSTHVYFTEKPAVNPPHTIPVAATASNPVQLTPAKVNNQGKLYSPILGSGKRGLPLRMLAYVLALLVGAGALLLPYQDRVAAGYTAITEHRLTADLRTEGQMKFVIDEFQRRAGHRSAVELSISKDRVNAALPIAEGKQETNDWSYSKAYAEDKGPAMIQPKSEREQFSMDEVNWDSIWPALQKGSQQAEIPVSEDAIVLVDRSTISDVHSPDFIQAYGPVQIRFTLEDDYHQAFFVMDANGKNLKMTGKQ
ncbi:hypothetical protein AUR04nite_20850 [Glutamicibacter uratoxydans]|uniref:DUF3592 domain-containing protein n=1 Tax=Glutamicibacter uratoxydans TaxID=43667 RepID=A0A4Y4DPK4_GLUUR|nr:hypothetical protein [Glutamicibacter uratoxydans]GED06553.1 hypothetical protein AUR04nite_20850 [Glutamicibacter uratoxydans]